MDYQVHTINNEKGKEARHMENLLGDLTMEKLMNELSYKFPNGESVKLISTSSIAMGKEFFFSYEYDRRDAKKYSTSKGWISFVHGETLYVARYTDKIRMLLQWHGYEWQNHTPHIPLVDAMPAIREAHIWGHGWW